MRTEACAARQALTLTPTRTLTQTLSNPNPTPHPNQAVPKAKRPMYTDGSRPMYALLARRAASPRPRKGSWR